MKHLARGATRLSVVALIGAALGIATTAAPVLGSGLAQQGEAATVAISPPDEIIGCGEEITLDVRINGASGLYGVDFRISYDPTVVEVRDASQESVGVQIRPGTFPDVSGGRGLIQVNNVDPGSGTIGYAATLINPTPPEPGTSGVAAQITFRGLATGATDIAFISVLLSDQPARPISAVPIDGRLRVRCDGGVTPSATRPPTTPPPPTTQPPSDKECHHVVLKGETLYSIARRYGTTVQSFMAVNNIANPDWIYAGQKLVIPGCDGDGPGNGPGPVPGPGPGPGDDCYSHSVKPGETMYHIALNTGDSVRGIATRNGVINPDWIYAGQTLTVCPSGAGWPSPKPGPGTGPGPKPGPGCSAMHIVKPGETLSGLAMWYGQPMHVLATINHLSNPNLIYAGMTLCIP